MKIAIIVIIGAVLLVTAAAALAFYIAGLCMEDFK